MSRVIVAIVAGLEEGRFGDPYDVRYSNLLSSRGRISS